jgi:hypothetical protein
MAEQETDLSINDVLFVALVRDFESMAWVGFGKVLDPVSEKAERNLERAKIAIDMLGMLEQKTKGNLDGMQAALLQEVLTNLRLNYVDEVQKQEAEKSSAETGQAKSSKSGEPDAGAGPESQESEGKEQNVSREGERAQPSGAEGKGAEQAADAEKGDAGAEGPAGDDLRREATKGRSAEADGESSRSAGGRRSSEAKKDSKPKGKTGGGEGGKRR